MIYIKTEYEIEQIKKACAVWKDVRDKLIPFIKEGVSLLQINDYAKQIIESHGCKCCFHKYNGFPGHICISVNDVVIHGVPTNYKIKDKDIITCDIGVDYNSYICDAAFSVVVGENPEAKKISDVCYQSLMEAIKIIKPNSTTIGDISHAVQQYVENNGYKVIENFGGHGCGKQLHEDPIILNYGTKGTGKKLRPGMIICIEPMILTDDNDYYIDKKDKWSVISKNHKLTCHWEHMVLVTENGYEILTE